MRIHSSIKSWIVEKKSELPLSELWKFNQRLITLSNLFIQKSQPNLCDSNTKCGFYLFRIIPHSPAQGQQTAHGSTDWCAMKISGVFLKTNKQTTGDSSIAHMIPLLGKVSKNSISYYRDTCYSLFFFTMARNTNNLDVYQWMNG